MMQTSREIAEERHRGWELKIYSLNILLFHENIFSYLQQDPLSHRIIEKRRRDRMNGKSEIFSFFNIIDGKKTLNLF